MNERGAGAVFAACVTAVFGMLQSARFFVASPAVGAGVVFAGALLGLGGCLFFAWLLRNFSRWFGAAASFRSVFTGLGYGLFPWSLLFLALLFALPDAGGADEVARIFSWFIFGFLYSYLILLLALTAALGISVLKTFLSLVVATLVTVFPATLFAQLLASLFA